jgi:hypothetical protein
MVFVLAAFLWLPASAHCQLGLIPGLEFFQCAADEHSDSACDPDKNGGDCGCFAVEKSQCCPGQLRLTPPARALMATFSLPSEQVKLDLPAAADPMVATSPPPLLKIWQFVSRAALPVRAPSFVS